MIKTIFTLVVLLPITLFAKDKTNKQELTGEIKVGKGNFERTLNYDFQVVYSKDTCTDSFNANCFDFSLDNESISYKAPKFSKHRKDLLDFLVQEVWYPTYAQKRLIMGKVFVHFEISELGEVTNIWVTKGVDISLDKEAVRTIMNMKFISPPLLNNKPIKICIHLPLVFELSE